MKNSFYIKITQIIYILLPYQVDVGTDIRYGARLRIKSLITTWRPISTESSNTSFSNTSEVRAHSLVILAPTIDGIP